MRMILCICTAGINCVLPILSYKEHEGLKFGMCVTSKWWRSYLKICGKIPHPQFPWILNFPSGFSRLKFEKRWFVLSGQWQLCAQLDWSSWNRPSLRNIFFTLVVEKASRAEVWVVHPTSTVDLAQIITSHGLNNTRDFHDSWFFRQGLLVLYSKRCRFVNSQRWFLLQTTPKSCTHVDAREWIWVRYMFFGKLCED